MNICCNEDCGERTNSCINIMLVMLARYKIADCCVLEVLKNSE
jgi:hypothetical protein